MNYPYILVLHEKWGDAFFLMEESKDVLDFSIKLLTERLESGYYHKPNTVQETFEEYFQGCHGMSVADAEELAEKHGKNIKLGMNFPADEIKSVKRAYAYRLNEVEEYDQIEHAVN